MATLSKSGFVTKYNDATTGQYKDNTTKDITPSRARSLITDLNDSVPFTSGDDPYSWARGNRAGVTAPASLKDIVTLTLGFGTQITFTDSTASNILRTYELTNETTAESSPDVIRPNDYATTTNEKVWRLRAVASTTAGVSDASDVTFTPAGNIAATDVQAAIEELEADVQAELRKTRTVTGTDASVQTDDNSLIVFNSATPFNFTLDQLTAATKISFVNIGAGAVTFINGSGVTLTGAAVLAGAVGTIYPGCFVLYQTSTTPRIFSGTDKRLTLTTTSTAGSTITTDCDNNIEVLFVGSASFSTPKTIARSNDTNVLVIQETYTITNVAGTLTFPSTTRAQTSDSRFNNTTQIFTPAATGRHEFSSAWDGTNWNIIISNPLG